MERLKLARRDIEVERIAGDGPTLVLLHEGLGSLGLWRDIPQALAARTGCEVIAYSRYGNGYSEPLAAKRDPRYMHDEARALPELLSHYGVIDPVLIGHSDGASIALIHAGTRKNVRALVLMAPHVFVEDVAISSIAATRNAYETTDLRERVARRHEDGDKTFYGWNDIWLDPAFRAWNIEEYLPAISCPVLLIQGRDDQYGTVVQLDAIERGVKGQVERLVLDDCRHAPHRDQPEATLVAIEDFLSRARRGS